MLASDELARYRASEAEQQRTADLLQLLPTGRRSVLDIGARDGHFSRLLADRFGEVTALDLQKPRFQIPGVVTVEGDVTHLQFADDSFGCVFCAEVLEHIPELEKACAEIVRVARHEIIIGVPFKQDIRVARTTCRSCGKTNPPWGHVNAFDEDRLTRLFARTERRSRSFVGTRQEATNPISTWLMDLAGNPWGTYEQEEACIHCGAHLTPPGDRAIWQKACSAIAAGLNQMQAHWTRPRGSWIHVVFQKNG